MRAGEVNRSMIITVLGSAGGVAKAVLALLNKAAQDVNDPIHSVISQCRLHLIDRKQKSEQYYRKLLPDVKNVIRHQLNVADLTRFRAHLKQTGTRIVIDVSWSDTVAVLGCCNGLGVHYINTALENAMIDKHAEAYRGFPLIERIRILENSRDDFTQTTAILCSGMNPGVVQWMALELMKRNPQESPLGCYVVEHDTSFFAKKRPEAEVLYTTWSTDLYLDEAVLSYPMLMRNRTPLFLHESVYAVEFKVTLGARQFYGSLMPHEEVYSLCRLYDMEGGFLYRVSEHTTDLVRAYLAYPDDLWDLEWELLDPENGPLTGEDLVGVLLVYPDKEVYMYNALSNQEVARLGVNATYYQVACGAYAALATLLLDQIPQGIYTVDELLLKTSSNYGRYVSHNLTDFVVGENLQSDGLLLQRMRRADI